MTRKNKFFIWAIGASTGMLTDAIFDSWPWYVWVISCFVLGGLSFLIAERIN